MGVTSLMALTSIGGYYNGAVINKAKHPQTLIERPLSAEELEGLEQMIRLLEQHLTRFSPYEERYAWTRDVVLHTARLLYRLQSPTATHAGQPVPGGSEP